MANKIVLKKSSVASKVPLATDLEYGEVAINYQDGKLYYKRADNTIDSFISSTASVAGVSSFNTRTGAITLGSSDVTTALGYTPLSLGGGALTGALTSSSTISHTGLVTTEGTNIDQIKTYTKSLTLTTDWQDVGINSVDLATGTYMVQLIANDIGSGGSNANEYYSGIMSWYSGDTDSGVAMPTDEIILHRAGASKEMNNITYSNLYLRTFKTPTADVNNLKLQIYSNAANASSANYVFKFRRMM